MAIVTQTLPAGQPLQPPSPTLTNPDMILPGIDRDSTPSPTFVSQRPPSPSALIKLADAPMGGRNTPPRTMSIGTQKSSRSHLADIDEEGAASRGLLLNDSVAGSPALRSKSSSSTINTWRPKKSNESGSVRSDEADNSRWAGFDSTMDVEHDQFEDQDHDQASPLPERTDDDEEEDLDDDRWLDAQEDDSPEMYSHNALSRRAEIILANAKKRLTLMEGNLRGARHSLLPPQHSLNSLKTASELSAQLTASRDRDRRLYGAQSFMPSRQRMFHSSPLSPTGGSHSRGLSETFTPGTPGGSIKKIHLSEKRASSALGPLPGPWSPSDSLQFPRSSSLRVVRGSRSQEQIRNERIVNWQATTIEEHPYRKLSSASSSHNLGPLPEYDTSASTNGLQRAPSAAKDLRSQMNDLKGRISSLQNRAREDSLKRRSMQNLRKPSPFTHAEDWQDDDADAYKEDHDLAVDAGSGSQGDEPTYLEHSALGPRKSVSPMENGHMDNDVMRSPASEYEESEYEDANEASAAFPLPDEAADMSTEPAYDEFGPNDDNGSEDEQDDEEDAIVDDGLSQSEQESIYMEPEYVPIAERHEDRFDAFDYENFFLHSAMGTYRATRRDSVSSEDSVETTRPLSPGNKATEEEEREEVERRSFSRPTFHHRNESASSVSSVNTFRTATEGLGSDYGSDEEATENLDEITQQIITHNRMTVIHNQQHPQHNGLQALALDGDRADSAVVIPEKQRPTENGIKHTPAQRMVQILTDSFSIPGQANSLGQQDRDLINALAVSFEGICESLQSTLPDEYDRRILRRRLDEARRMLDGTWEGEPF